MKRFLLLSIAAVAVSLLLTQTGCKSGNEPFTVQGIWEVDQTVTYDDGNTEIQTIRYEFKGNDTDGNVATVPLLPAGLFGGQYHVAGNHIDFSYRIGRGPAWSATHYTGDLYPGIGMIRGTLTGENTFYTVVNRTWTGSFIATKIETGTTSQ